MKQHPDIDLLLGVIEKMGISVRVEPCESSGGLVRIKEKTCLFLDPGNDPQTTIDICVRALGKIDTSGVFLPPRVRMLMEEGHT